MRQHPEHGARLAGEFLGWLGEWAGGILHHHERWDGGGYPDRLAGEDIPHAARVFAVADTIDALTTDRPYRPGGSFADARRVVASGAGTQFCPTCVAALHEVSDHRLEELRMGISA